MNQLTNISFSHLSEFYLEELRQGNCIPLEVLEQEFPQFREQIRSQLSTMELLERTLGSTASRPAPLRVGDRVGTLEIVEEIGRGGMGRVFKARQTGMDRLVAVKFISVENQNSHKILQRIELERTAMERLDHGNIIPIYSFGYHGNYAYLVMRWIDGVSLDQLTQIPPKLECARMLAELHSDFGQLVQIGLDVAAGLEHAHDQGLVHRDIKPANLIFDRRGKTWIADFGLAKIYDFAASLSNTGDIIGTPRYMAPEQMRGIVDPRSDLYSLGLSLYELASGKRVWENSESTCLPPILSQNPNVPEELAYIIDKACQPEPQARFQSAKELRVVLTRFNDHIKPADRRRQPKRPDNATYHRIYQRNRRIAWMAGGGTLLVIAGLLAVPILFRQNRLAEPLALNKPEQNTIKAYHRLVDELGADDKTFVSAIGNFVKGSVADMSEQYQLHEPTSQTIESKIDQVLTKIDQQGIDDEALDSIAENFQNSSLPTAMKVMELTYPLAVSGLSDHEKGQAVYTLQLLGRLIVNRGMAQDEAENIVAGLFQGRRPDIHELRQEVIPDRVWRSWLSFVNESLGSQLEQVAQQSTAIDAELDAILNSYLEAARGN